VILVEKRNGATIFQLEPCWFWAYAIIWPDGYETKTLSLEAARKEADSRGTGND
jgi:hypothetical protein